MAGPGMEIFRMTFYVMLPIGMFYYFGLPDFYKNQVLPAFKKVYPDDMPTQSVPTTPEGNKELLDQLIAARRKRQAEAQNQQQQQQE
ncbi:hypothetical protein PTSG_04293 [Salpingoeca rosetta]|uniref:Protein PET100 n=1 Tax=Salpingoeca rosetta (strain ATCC 50818 / BSB-021) TaxID=946362 RepID=F2U757_SALR5|nr:uncharacterized protein PTSG_04293 [Salpingoeca rosetta]EGD83689.1 hypothetical protein PTSG_04293 [Salpingoeca rosetta]|eukprot:XP_004995193.1 hypothetical protein PTSG_04293 [Salpingoeca rosetta]